MDINAQNTFMARTSIELNDGLMDRAMRGTGFCLGFNEVESLSDAEDADRPGPESSRPHYHVRRRVRALAIGGTEWDSK